MSDNSAVSSLRPAPLFTAPYAAADEAIAARLLAGHAPDQESEAQIDTMATDLIAAIRAREGIFGGVEDVLHAYSLTTKEGVALMMLAEALLRVPDAGTADRFIEDKIAHTDWRRRETKPDTLLVSASVWGLALAARVATPSESPRDVLAELTRRIGLPAVRGAIRAAIGVVGNHFVLGQTIEGAVATVSGQYNQQESYSFDMLGEGARTAGDAQRYFQSYAHAIETVARASTQWSEDRRPGISIKLSALHPRYEAISRTRVLSELAPALNRLLRQARSSNLEVTIDAEEADRLELSLEVIAAALADKALDGWNGFGLAVQAYQKRAREVIEYVHALAHWLGRQFTVRLVKGAYWDSEIKRAQERGLDDFPVFTRKAMTDLNYIDCARLLLGLRPTLRPQLATHNALTVATLLQLAGAGGGFEFQRLHGMGEQLYARLREVRPDLACRIYAPVGNHKELLAYLVRRLLENGANSSFVYRVANPKTSLTSLLERPVSALGGAEKARNPAIVRPADLFAPERQNSRGVEFGCRAQLQGLIDEIAPWRTRHVEARGIVGGEFNDGAARPCFSPIDGAQIGSVCETDLRLVPRIVECAREGAARWNAVSVQERAQVLERAADLLELRRGVFLALLQAEGGKTLDDALAETREAIDYCRYYASQARRLFVDLILPGPAGEENVLRHRGRGVFLCISPWNFPLAIFLGQVSAALACGNAVIAKPAEQTPLVAFEAVRLMHETGVPKNALHFAPGDGAVGAALVAHNSIDGVAFTGSTEVAWKINRALAAKNAPIAPLIAETGGVNAMIVDGTALAEQVTDDVVASAFRSAGQRCSALRLLCLQEEIADQMLKMIIGAARELRIGDPRDPATHVGPLIDAAACQALQDYIEANRERVLYAGRAPAGGSFFAPCVLEIPRVADLRREVFGPVLHVVRWRAHVNDRDRPDGLLALLDEIAASDFALTLGVHSRINETVGLITERLAHGNVYVNRSMIGAVVGSQPFGGSGLSGTGPKAGGPHYLGRFAREQTISTNTAAAGGNIGLATGAEGASDSR